VRPFQASFLVLAAFGVGFTPVAVHAGDGAELQDPQPSDLVEYSIDDDPGGDGDGDVEGPAGDGDGDVPPVAPMVDERPVPKSEDLSYMALQPKRGIGLVVAGGTMFLLGLAGSAGGAALVVNQCSQGLENQSSAEGSVEGAINEGLQTTNCFVFSLGGYFLQGFAGVLQLTGTALAIPGAVRMGKHAAFENHFIRRHPPKRQTGVIAAGGAVLGVGVLSWVAGPIIRRSRCDSLRETASPATAPNGQTAREGVVCRLAADTTAFNVGLTGITVGAMMLGYGLAYKKMARRHAATYPLSFAPSFNRYGGSFHVAGRF
jgi:hypothetical protein